MFVNVNWNTFQGKFGAASEDEFQRLCTLIFCRMYNRPFGIAAYRNHPGLETMSIEVDGKHLGVQAKLYLGKFSNYTSKIKKAVSQAVNHHPELDELLFFLPMDLDYSPKGKGNNRPTQAQRAVEKMAEEKGVKIRWFGHSQFQTTLADKSYEYWTCHFFHPSLDILKFVESVERRKEQRFCNAKNSIEANGFHVAIDRSADIKKILESPSRAIVVTGEGGVGKTALINSLDEALPGPGLHCLGLYELADSFAEQKLASAWSIGLKDFLDLHSDCQKRILIVDEAEKTEWLFPPGNTEAIAPILADFHGAGWTIVFVTRPSHAEMWVDFCKTILQTPPAVVEIPRLTPETLKQLADANGFSLPSDLLIRDLIRIPFYLKEFLSLSEGERAGNFSDFKRHLWNCRIRGNDPFDMTSNVFVDMMDRRLRGGTYWVDVHPSESEAAKGLLQRGILARDPEKEWCYLTHDIYEEWALEKIIARAFADSGDNPNLWVRLQDKPAMHRAYRSWMADSLYRDETSVKNLVESSLTGTPTPWQRETLLAMVASPTGEDFLKLHLPHLLSNGGQLLQEIEALVRLSCREPAPKVERASLENMGYDPESAEFHFLTKPCGREWETLIHFLYENRQDVLKVEQDETLKVLHEWCITYPQGPTTADAARLALAIASANVGTTWDTHLFDRTSEKFLFETLSFGAAEIKEELEKCIGSYLDFHEDDSGDFPANYCEAIIDYSKDHIPFIIVLPGVTRRMLATLFHPTPREQESWTDSSERKMGILQHGVIDNRPLSAYQTPMYWLLKYDFNDTLDFFINWINDLASTWAHSDTNTTTTTFIAENGSHYEQYISDALWCANRGCGSPVLPRVFVCAHMALEKCLLEQDTKCQDGKKAKLLVEICLYIFRKSRTASLSGVLNTLVLKNPDRYFEVASLLASSFEAIHFDWRRAQFNEVTCKYLYRVALREEVPYWKEREKTLYESFRHKSLDHVIVGYQVNQSPERERRRKRMEAILDRFSQTGAKERIEFVSRTDCRRMRVEYIQDETGTQMVVAYPQLPPEIAEEHRKWKEAQTPIKLGLDLKLWAEKKIEGNPITGQLRVYETDKSQLLSDCQTVLSTSPEGKYKLLLQSAKPVIAAALLACFPEDLGDEIRIQCKQIVRQTVRSFLSAPPMVRVVSIFDMVPVFSALAVLADDPDPAFAVEAWGTTLLGMLQEAGHMDIAQGVFKAIRQKAEVEKGYEQRFLVPYLLLKTKYDVFLNTLEVKKQLLSGNHSPELLFMEQGYSLENELDHCVGDISYLQGRSYSPEASMNVVAMIPEGAMANDVFCQCVFLENIERVLGFIYHVDEKRRVRHRFSPAVQCYQAFFAKMLFRLEMEDVEAVLEHIAQIPLAMCDSSFIEAIVFEANKLNARPAFWTIWNDLRPVMGRLLKDKTITRAWNLDIETAFDAYFLGSSIWFGQPEACQLVEKDDLQFFMKCLEEWEKPLVVVVAFQSFLASAGLRYWEEGMPMLGNILEHLQVGTDARREKALVNICGQYMKRLLKEHGDTIRKRTPPRQAAQAIIRFLKAEKSQAGYDLANYVM